MREIADGTLPVGSRLPSEVELAERHGLSRTTVRSALDLVEELGLVSRRRKLGTVVEATRPRAEYVASMTTLQELIQYAEQTERVLHSVDHVVCDAGLARRLECAPGDGWMHVTMTRVEPQRRDSPICVTDVYLEPELGHAVRDQLSRPDGLICSMVEQRSGRFVVSITQSFRAVLLTERQAGLVNAPPRRARAHPPLPRSARRDLPDHHQHASCRPVHLPVRPAPRPGCRTRRHRVGPLTAGGRRPRQTRRTPGVLRHRSGRGAAHGRRPARRAWCSPAPGPRARYRAAPRRR